MSNRPQRAHQRPSCVTPREAGRHRRGQRPLLSSVNHVTLPAASRPHSSQARREGLGSEGLAGPGSGSALPPPRHGRAERPPPAQAQVRTRRNQPAESTTEQMNGATEEPQICSQARAPSVTGFPRSAPSAPPTMKTLLILANKTFVVC